MEGPCQQGRGHLGRKLLQLLRKSWGGTPNLAPISIPDASFSTDLPNELAGAGLSHRLWTQAKWGDTERTIHLSGPKSMTLGTLRPELSDTSEGFGRGPRSPLSGPWRSASGLGCPRSAGPVTDGDRHAGVRACSGGLIPDAFAGPRPHLSVTLHLSKCEHTASRPPSFREPLAEVWARYGPPEGALPLLSRRSPWLRAPWPA